MIIIIIIILSNSNLHISYFFPSFFCFFPLCSFVFLFVFTLPPIFLLSIPEILVAEAK